MQGHGVETMIAHESGQPVGIGDARNVVADDLGAGGAVGQDGVVHVFASHSMKSLDPETAAGSSQAAQEGSHLLTGHAGVEDLPSDAFHLHDHHMVAHRPGRLHARQPIGRDLLQIAQFLAGRLSRASRPGPGGGATPPPIGRLRRDFDGPINLDGQRRQKRRP